MGSGYDIKCSSCDYSFSVWEGIGMMYSPHAVFYGRCDDPTQNWSIAFPDGFCENGEPLLFSLVEDDEIREKASLLLNNGAEPGGYGHKVYICPKCMQLENRFYFKLHLQSEDYEPDYKCLHCNTSLRCVELKQHKDGQIEIVDENHRKVNWLCPKCGNDRLIFGELCMCWD